MNTTTVLSATSIVGDNVRNRQGEDLGTIEDLMIDLTDGGTRYAVVSFGGVLGVGNKLFAVPFDAFEVDTADECFVLDVDKQRLENAPGFDKDDWPDFADPSFADSVQSYYRR